MIVGTDTTPPARPSAPTLFSSSSTGATITWIPATDNIGVAGYNIYRDGAVVAQIATPNFRDTGLTPGATYIYGLSAFDAQGNVSAESETLTVTLIDLTPPTVPTGLAVTGVTQTSVSLTWSASTGGGGVAGYRLLKGTSPSTIKIVQGSVLGTSYVDSRVSPKTTYYYAVESYNETGISSAPSTTISAIPSSSGVPAVVSVTPDAGSTASQSFALLYSDTAGAASLGSVWVWFNPSLTVTPNSCELYYLPSTNQVGLLNDASSAWTTGTVGAATTLQNSQCSVNLAATSVNSSSDNLTLNLPMTFLAAFAGAKNIYMYAADVSGSNTGWIQRGTWTVAGSGPTPAVVSVTPSSGSGASQSFTFQYSDTGGTGSLSWVWAWFSASIGSGASSCVLYYQPSTNQVNLLNDAGTAWTAATPGAATTLQNSQCSLNVASTSATPSGNNLALDLAMTFKPAFNGTQNTYMYAGDVSGSNTGWIQRGTWDSSRQRGHAVRLFQ